MFGTAAIEYDKMRRNRMRQTWTMNGRAGMQGYAAYLMGYGDDAGGAVADISAMTGGGTAAFESLGDSSMWRAVGIGVATGVTTFLLNRWLGKVLR